MSDQTGLLRYVNVLQGTDSHFGFSTGNTLPLVARPFGMNHWSAQTSEGSGWFFSPRDRKLQGVRCTHQPSPWMGDYGHFVIMANTGPETHLSAGRRARAYHGEFHPNRLRVELLNDGTSIEMSPTTRGAIFNFRFPVGGGRVILEPVSGLSGVEFVDEQNVTGWVSGNSGGVPKGFAHYFVVRFSLPLNSIQAFEGEKTISEWVGDRVGFVATFPASVSMKIATSFISVEQAWQNLERELANAIDLETVANEGGQIWEEALGKIEVESPDDDQLRTFYSCLYRTQLFPRIWHEPNSMGGIHHRSPFSGQIHEGPLYTDNGFWDTYRTVYPLFALLQPDRLAEILEGWVNAFKEGGWFPQWASPGYRACMVGTHIDAVVADAVARGVLNFDIRTALKGMCQHATEVGDPNGAWGRIGILDYIQRGYVTTDHHESVARSLDYAYDDWCIHQVASHLGISDHPEDSVFQTYQNLFDPEVGFMRAKNPDGSWLEPWDEFHWGNPYVEGGPWQASWAVQHDAAGLIRLVGGDEAFADKLDTLLKTPPFFTTGAYGYEIHEMTEMAQANFGQYAHSNQPVHHILYLYNAAGRPWRTQEEVRKVMERLYSPDDLPGDEDNGEMSAWYVLSALGIYPLTPGHPSWSLGSPLFSKARINLPNGQTFDIDASGHSSEAVFVSKTRLNGEPHQRLYISHDEISQGGELHFEMSSMVTNESVPGELRPYSLSPYG